jgi:hypothetical protein
MMINIGLDKAFFGREIPKFFSGAYIKNKSPDVRLRHAGLWLVFGDGHD